MAIVTTITEAEVKQYMEDVLGDTASKLGWSVAGDDFDEPANEVLYTLGVDDFSAVSTRDGVAQVRAVARMEVWRHAMFYTAHEASFSAGNPGTGQTSRGEIHRSSKALYELARQEVNDQFPSLLPQDTREVVRYPVKYEDDYWANAESDDS